MDEVFFLSMACKLFDLNCETHAESPQTVESPHENHHGAGPHRHGEEAFSQRQKCHRAILCLRGGSAVRTYTRHCPKLGSVTACLRRHLRPFSGCASCLYSRSRCLFSPISLFLSSRSERVNMHMVSRA